MPSCTTNLTPIDGAVLTTTSTANLSWNVATGSPTGYKVFIYPFGGSPGVTPDYTTATTSQTATGLTQNTHYSYLVVPYNISGDAVGCTSFTSFTTAAIVPVTYNQLNVLRQ